MKKLAISFISIAFLSFFSISSTEAKELLYPGYGSVFNYGVHSILSQETKDLEDIINNYKKQTNIEIGIVLTQNFKKYYTGNYDYFIDTYLPGKGFSPKGFLLGVDMSNRKTYLRVDSSMEFGSKGWNSYNTNSLLNHKLIPEIKDGNLYRGLKDSIIYITQTLTDPVDVMNAKAIEAKKVDVVLAEHAREEAEKIRTEFQTNTRLLILKIFAILVGLRTAWWLIQKSRLKLAIYRIESFYNNTIPVLKGGLLGIQNNNKNISAEGLNKLETLNERLAILNNKIENFTAENFHTILEASQIEEIIQPLELDINYFISNFKKIEIENIKDFKKFDEEQASKKILISNLKKDLSNKIKSINL